MIEISSWVELLKEQLAHTDGVQWAVLILGVTEVLLARANLFRKELPLFALLTIFLFIVACKGYVDWVRLFKKSVFVSNH